MSSEGRGRGSPGLAKEKKLEFGVGVAAEETFASEKGCT